MTRSSRHKSHKQSKHSSKDYYSDSDEDVKMDRTSYKDDNSVRSHRDSASGEKRKVVSLVREGKEGKEVLDEYVSTKRRKEKWDVADVGGDRWNGGGDERGDVEKESSVKVESKSRESGSKGELLRVESKSRESGSKGEVLRVESKSKSRRYETGNAGQKKEKEDSLVEKEEGKGKGESKRKSEKDYSSRKEKETKDKERKLEKEKEKSGHESKRDVEMKSVEVDVVKKEVSRSGDVSEDRHGKRSRPNADRAEDGSWNPELEKESEKKMHKSREVSSERDKHRNEVSSERDKHRNDFKEPSERRLSTRSDRAKETKHGDDKKTDESYVDKNQEDGHKDVRQRDDKNRKESDKDTKYWDAKYREDGEKEARHRDDKREESSKDHRRKDEKHRDKYKEGTEREHRDDKYYKDDRYHEDDYKDTRKDEKYYEDGERDNRVKDGKHREDDVRHKDKKLGDDVDRENRQRSTKYRDDGYAADRHHSRKSNVHDDSPTRDGRTSARYRDDQARRKLNERDDYGDVRSRSTKDQRSNVEEKSATVDVVPERGRSTSRTADIELGSGSRRRNSPGLSSHDARDHFRVPKHDESKFKDINYEDRVRHSTSSTREYAAPGGSEKTSPWSLEKNGQKGDVQLGELSGERRRNSDIRPSPLQRRDKSPSSNTTDKRQFSRSDVRSTGFRDAGEYTGKEGRDVLPGNDFSQADTDSISVSSPFARNSHFSNSSKSYPPPPHFRAGMDSPFPLHSTEDESRGKSNNRQRRIVDPNMGRMQGNAWRGLPSWPSPVPNGFMPFHAPPPVNFIQPFPAPPVFGVRPSLELNHSLSSPYHIPDADRFSGQVHPMWRNPVDGSFSPWDPSSSCFGDESHNYGRPNWDPSRNMPGVRGWETSGDLWKESNKTGSLEKENNSTRSEGQSVKPAQSEQAQAEEQAESNGVSQSSRSGVKNEVEAPVIGQEEGSDKLSEKGDLCLSHVYLSRLDISADLVEPEVFDRCSVLIDMDQNVVSDVDDSKIICMEEAVKFEVAHEKLSYTLFPSTDDSIFQKAMSLYKRQRGQFKAEVGEKIKFPSIPNSDQEAQLAEMLETEKVSPTEDMQGVEVDSANKELPVLEMDVETTQKEMDQPTDAEITEKPEEHENVKLPDASLPTGLKEVSEESENLNQEVDTKHGDLNQEVDTKLGDLNQEVDTELSDHILNNDVSSEVEAVMHESVVSGPVNLSRIHHSPESTH